MVRWRMVGRAWKGTLGRVGFGRLEWGEIG